MRRKRYGAGLIGLCVLLTSLMLQGATGAATTSHAPSSKAVKGGNLTVEFPGTTWTLLFPTYGAGSADAPSNLVWYDLMFGTLFTVQPHAVLAPGLATKWSTSKNGLVATIALRKGVKFQDGTPFNAAAVAWNIRFDLTPSNGCTCLPQINDILSVSTPNATTVRLALRTPSASLMDAFAEGAAAFMVSPTAEQSEGPTQFGAAPVGAGPYKLTSNTVDSQMVLSRWPGYWDAAHTYLSTITFLYTATESTAFQSVEAGQAQLELSAGPQSYQQARANSQLATQNPPSLNWSYMQINTETAPFNNPVAREALAYATNPLPVASTVFLGYAKKIDVFGAPGMRYYPRYDPAAYDYPTYNLAKAESLVASIPGGLSFTLSTIQNSTTQVQLAQALYSELTSAGMHVTLNTPALATGVKNLESGNFQVLISQQGGYEDPALILAQKLQSHELFNTGYSNPAMDSLLAQGAATLNPVARGTVYKRVWKLSNQDLGYYPLFSVPTLKIFSKKLQGIPDIVYPELSGAWFSR